MWFCGADELPEGFSHKMQEESQKSRSRFQPSAQQKPTAASPRAPTDSCKETTKVCVCVCACLKMG